MNMKLMRLQVNFKGASLDDLLQEISVIDTLDLSLPDNFDNWFAVCDNGGIIAYFSTEPEAFRYRLDLINRILNS